MVAIRAGAVCTLALGAHVVAVGAFAGAALVVVAVVLAVGVTVVDVVDVVVVDNRFVSAAWAVSVVMWFSLVMGHDSPFQDAALRMIFTTIQSVFSLFPLNRSRLFKSIRLRYFQH